MSQSGDWNGAAEAYRQALALSPNPLGYYGLGLALLNLERRDEAIDILTQGLELEPDFYKLYLPLGQAFLQQQDWPAALNAYRKAVALKPELAEANLQLGQLLRRQGQLPEAAALGFYRRRGKLASV